MKWFKHISDSLDDPFIFDLIQKHDANGYLVFFGILEIYAREFKTELGWKLQITLPYLRKKMNRTRNKLITNVLETLKKAGKWEIRIEGEDITIFIPKFRELMDESTLKKLRESEKYFRNHSGTIPPDEPTDKDREEDIPPTPTIPYPDFVSKHVWDDFIEHRKVIKKRLSVTSAEYTIKKLAKWKGEGIDPEEVLKESIANGWQGIFRPKDQPTKKVSW